VTSSATYSFQPGAGEVILAAYSMCGIRRTQIVTEHLVDAAYQSNMLMSELTNANPWQWTLETQSIPLTAGLGVYTLTPRTVAIAVAYIETTTGTAPNTVTTGRVMGVLSASEYAAIPNKGQQGFPNSYWLNLGVSTPTITLYFVPDSAYTYTMQLQTFRQLQDVNPANGQTLDIPYRFLDAFTTGLAYRLAGIYAPQRKQDLKMDYAERLTAAAAQDQERVPMHIYPGLSGYFR